MPAIGMIMSLGGYGISLWGYCLLTGQNVKLTQLFNPVNVYKWNSGGKIPDTSLLPDGSAAATTSSGAPAAAPGPPVASPGQAAPIIGQR